MILLTFVEINDLFSKNVLDLKAFLKSNIAIQLFINVDNLILIKIYSLDNIFFFLLMSFYVRLLTHEFHYVATNYKMLCHMFKIINLHEYIYIYIYINSFSHGLDARMSPYSILYSKLSAHLILQYHYIFEFQ